MLGVLLAAWIGVSLVTPTSGRVFLVPILPYGPNNQIQALREVSALAHALNYTVVSYGLLPHFMESDVNRTVRTVPSDEWEVEPSSDRILPLDLVIDRSTLTTTTQVVTHKEAVKQHGFNGRLDRVLQFRDLPEIELDLMHLYNKRLIDALDAEIVFVKKFECDPVDLVKVESLIGDRTFVGIITFAGALTNGIFNEWVEPTEAHTPCSRALVEIITNMRMSKQTVDAARAFVQRHVPMQPTQQPRAMSLWGQKASSGIPQPFIALHVRPWPDACLTYWVREQGPLDPKTHKRICAHKKLGWGTRTLMSDIVVALLSVVKLPPFDELLLEKKVYIFVMCHPKIRHKVVSELRRHLEAATEGRLIVPKPQWWEALLLPFKKRRQRTIYPEAAVALLEALYEDGDDADQRLLFFLDEEDLPSAFRERPEGINTLLALTEQQVCRDAHTFIGTGMSSMTHNVMQERMALQWQDRTGVRAGYNMLAVR